MPPGNPSYQLQASSSPDIKAGNWPCWKPNQKLLIFSLPQFQTLAPDPPGFLPNAFALLSWYQTPMQNICEQGGARISASATWGGRCCLASWVRICPAEHHDWLRHSWRDPVLTTTCLIPHIWKIPEGKTVMKREWGSCNVSQHFKKGWPHTKSQDFHCKSSVHWARHQPSSGPWLIK